MLNLPQPSPAYSATNEAQTRDAIRRELDKAYKRGQDVEFQPGQRLILRSAGGRWLVNVDDAGGLYLTPLDAPPIPITAAEALSAGMACNIFSSGGVCAIRKADNTDKTKRCDAFVLKAYSMGDDVAPYWPGQLIEGLTSLSPGGRYFLGTAGALTLAPPSTEGSGNLRQEVGLALSATQLQFKPGEAIRL